MEQKYYRLIMWHGKVEKIECVNHSYAYSGRIPCTGVYRCVHCGKIGDLYKKEVINENFETRSLHSKNKQAQ
jgi:hypothetical protein